MVSQEKWAVGAETTLGVIYGGCCPPSLETEVLSGALNIESQCRLNIAVLCLPVSFSLRVILTVS